MRKWTILSLLTLFLVLNGLLVWNRTRGREGRYVGPDSLEGRSERTRRLLDWKSQKVTLLSSQELPQAVASIKTAGCMQIPQGARPVPLADLNEVQRSDLDRIVVDLLCAYHTATAEEVLTAFNRCDEVVNPSRADDKRKLLLKMPGYKAEQVQGMTEDEVFAEFWKASQLLPHWDGIIASASCRAIWRSGSLTASSVRDTSQQTTEATTTWGGIVNFHHSFIPANGYTLEDALQAGEELLLADVLAVVQHDAETFNDIAPYLFRFWYNSKAECWQPIALAQFQTFERPPRIAF